MNCINIILSSIIPSIFAILSVRNLSQEKVDFKTILKFVLIIFPLLNLNYLYFTGITRLILNIIITNSAFYFSMFNNDMSKSLYYTLVYEMFAFICELLISVVILLIFRINYETYASLPFSLLISSLLNCILIYLITKIKFIQNCTIKLSDIIKKNNRDWLYITIIVLVMIFLMTYNRYNMDSNLKYYIIVGMVVFVTITMIYVIKNKFEKENIENKYNEMMDYVSKYEKIINEQGKKNHEYNNQLMVLSGYINNKTKLKEYLSTIIEEYKTGQNYRIKQLGYLPDGGIKGLIYHKLSKMEDNDIKSYLYIDQNIKNIFEEKLEIETYIDVTKLLGVFLDNAIDAAMLSTEKEIELDMRKQTKNLVIVISNTFKKNDNVLQVGKKGFTTKGNGHGFGLSIVKDITKRNDNIDTIYEFQENKFLQTIIIYYKK